MLVLTRKPGEKVVIDGNITVTLVETKGNRVRLGIDAPPHVPIFRVELFPLSGPHYVQARSEKLISQRAEGKRSF